MQRTMLRALVVGNVGGCWRPSLSSRASSSSSASSSVGPWRICVVGAGPAGFYLTDKILRTLGDQASVTLLERLPSPYGLVRTGVAPDHPDTKNVMNQFARVAADERCRYLGNVTVGKDVSLAELRDLFDVVALAYGAEDDRTMNIPGESLRHVLSAREFVAWYNGHPMHRHLPNVDWSRIKSVGIIGLGNVALDCARILLQPRSVLAVTDMASHAVQALAQSRVEHVHLIARRGIVQAACTPKELRELLRLAGLVTHVKPDDLHLTETDRARLALHRVQRRVYEVLSQATLSGEAVDHSGEASAAAGIRAVFGGMGGRRKRATPSVGASLDAESSMSAATATTMMMTSLSPLSSPPPRRDLSFHFCQTPIALEPNSSDPTRVGMIRLERNRLVTRESDASVHAVGTGTFDTLACDLVLRSIGYKSKPIPGLPFDAASGMVVHRAGRVHDPVVNAPMSGVYVSGWLRRGPSGIIATNLADAEETAETMAADLRNGSIKRRRAGPDLATLLAQRHVRIVDWDAWLRIDAEEVRRGAILGKPRDKVTSIDDMLAIAET